MDQLYKVNVVRLASGERLPVLIGAGSGMPHGIAADFSLAFHRGVPINTSKRSVDAIGIFQTWADHLGVNLDERFGTGELFTSDEITGLSAAIWERRQHGTADQNDLMHPVSVVGETHGHRSDEIVRYIKWRTHQIVSTMSVHDGRVASINSRLEAIAEQLRTLKGSSVSIPRGELTPEQCARLFQIVRPGSPENPFHNETQLRNFFVLLLYYELGVRKAEPLTLKGVHLKFGPRSLVTMTFTPNDPKDIRKNQPSQKTVSRTLPMSRLLATTADRLTRQRSQNGRTAVAAKKTPFVVLDTDKGVPLSLDAVYGIFIVLRRRFPADFPPDFAAHHLRRSWNYRFTKGCEAADIETSEQDHIRRYIMGWSKTSSQPGKYNRRAIEEKAFDILLGMQNALTGIEL